MKAQALQVHWHNEDQPIYSAHFEVHGKGRLATAGGDSCVRIWRLESEGPEDIPSVVYLSTLTRHTQAVNVVRFSPKGEQLASAGDDGNVLIWVPSDIKDSVLTENLDENGPDQEHWRVKLMCRSSSGSEIYDLAWSPDGNYLITGSMDNIARIYDARDGQCVRQIAEHNHYVQGVAWDPLNEFVATQSSDRSLNVYNVKSKDGQLLVSNAQSSSKMSVPSFARRVNSSSPAPEARTSSHSHHAEGTNAASPSPSAPGTPTSVALPMRPPAITPSRRSSFNDPASHRGRSPSPMPGIPLPAVKPSGSPARGSSKSRPTHLYHDEALLTFFRRLTFTPDGSLLLAPAGQHKQSIEGGAKDEILNTVYIYSRAGLAKPPVAHLPNQKKTAVAIRCAPVVFRLRERPSETVQRTIEPPTDDLANLPPPHKDLPEVAIDATLDLEPDPSQKSEADAFKLPYRVVFAVATGDAVMVYDTQQQTPLAILSNLHYATFTDLAWSNDGHTLIMTSTDGFCSVCVFTEEDLGTVYHNPPFPKHVKRDDMAQKIDFPVPVPNRSASPARSNSMTSNASNSVSQTRGSFSLPSPLSSGINALQTPPQTPAADPAQGPISLRPSSAVSVSTAETKSKRAADDPVADLADVPKKRRIQPILVSSVSTLLAVPEITEVERNQGSAIEDDATPPVER